MLGRQHFAVSEHGLVFSGRGKLYMAGNYALATHQKISAVDNLLVVKTRGSFTRNFPFVKIRRIQNETSKPEVI